MYGGERTPPLGPTPVDIEQLAVDVAASKQMGPSALRNSSEAGRFYEGLLDQPVAELSLVNTEGVAGPQVPLPMPAAPSTVGVIPPPGQIVGF